MRKIMYALASLAAVAMVKFGKRRADMCNGARQVDVSAPGTAQAFQQTSTGPYRTD